MAVTPQQRQAVFEALARHQRRGAISDLEALGKALGDESDRGMVVIIGSLTEDLLLEEIVKRLPPIEEKQLKNLTRQGGVLSGWADKVNFARAIGIIDDDVLQYLEVLNSMRNACAHSRQHIDFDTEELLDMFCLMFTQVNDGDPFALKNLRNRELMRAVLLNTASFYWSLIRGEESQEHFARLRQIAPHAIRPGRLQSSQRKPSTQPSQGGDKAPNG